MSEARQCPSCGAANRESAKFCNECGSSLQVETKCPACGSVQDPHAKFCDECGGSLRGPPSAAPQRRSPDPESFADGRYVVERFLGQGARKRVFLARDGVLGREVAVAAFKSEGVDETALVRARREAEAMGRLGDHPNIVTVHDMGEEDGGLYLVSQHMSGGELSDLVAAAEGGRLAVEEALRIGTEVCAALEHAHAHGVIHRDVKPQNIWLAPDGTAKLGDFGLALASDRSRVTHEGMMVGTVAYMPPEQGLGRTADARSDLYSLGAVLYELLCGVPPFTGPDAASVISQHVSSVPVAPSWHRPEVPKALEQLVLKLLAKTPEERLQTASEALAALRAIEMHSSGIGEPALDGAEALERLRAGALLGRDAEMKELRAGVDEAVAGRGRLVAVTGDAGIGKTRVAGEAETYADLRGAQVLWGRCYEGDGAPAYWPWIQAIRAYVHTRDPDALRSELGSGASDIAQVVSELRARLPDLPEAQPLDPEQARFRLFDSITTFLRNAAHARPLAIFLEDLHLADSPSLLLLRFIARELTGSRILLLVTYREEELDGAHALVEIEAALSHERGFQRLRLRGLERHEVKSMLEDLARQTLESTAELALVDAVHRASGGNPYFIEETLRHLVESGAIYERDGRWVSDARHVDELGIPAGIREAVERRLARLSDEARGLLSTAAAVGPEFGIETLATIEGIETVDVLERLGPALDAAIVAPVAEHVNQYRFIHVASRDALYDAIPAARRLTLHKEVGETLEAVFGDRIESHLGELAHHFARAGVVEKAADYSWWAGERAVSVAAYEDAVEHYGRALRLFNTQSEEPVRRAELMIALGDAQWRAGDTDQSRETFREAARLASRHAALTDQFARAALGFGGGLGGLTAGTRADDELVELLRAALRALPERDSGLRVRVLSRLAVELYYTGDSAEPASLSAEAVEMAERNGDPRMLLLALYAREWATMGPDRVEEALGEADEIVRLARLLEDREMEFKGRHLKVNKLLQLGDMRGVDGEIRVCEELARSLRQPSYDWQALVFRTMRAAMRGRYAEAARLAQSSFTVGQQGQGEIAAVIYGAHLFLIHWAAGTLEELRDGADEFAGRYPVSAWPSARAWLLSEIEDREAAEEAFAALAADGFQSIRRDSNWLTAMCCLALACGYLDDAASAAVLYDMLAPYADRYTSILAGAATLGSNHVFLGQLSLTAGRPGDAVGHLEHALERHESLGATFAIPRICVILARALIARDASGDRERWAEVSDRGIEAARVNGMPKEAEKLLALRLAQRGQADVGIQTSIDAVVRSVEEEPPDLKRVSAPDGTVTIMFSDIEDSTALTERLGDRRWLALLKEHNRIVRRSLEIHGGYEVKSQGDGFMVAFASAAKAVHCAIAIQRRLSEHRAAESELALRVRIGLHTGETLREESDFFGKNVILAARIAAKAAGSQILVSAVLRELVASSEDFTFDKGAELELKGLSGHYRVFAVDWGAEAGAGADPSGAALATPETLPGALA